MCLDTLINYVPSDSSEEFIGYKIFTSKGKSKKKLEFQFDDDLELKFNKWLKSTNIKLHSSAGDYKSGFHIFTNIKDARNWKGPFNYTWLTRSWNFIRKVKYRNIVAKGYQDDLLVVVAKEIKILKGEV